MCPQSLNTSWPFLRCYLLVWREGDHYPFVFHKRVLLTFWCLPGETTKVNRILCKAREGTAQGRGSVSSLRVCPGYKWESTPSLRNRTAGGLGWGGARIPGRGISDSRAGEGQESLYQKYWFYHFLNTLLPLIFKTPLLNPKPGIWKPGQTIFVWLKIIPCPWMMRSLICDMLVFP